MDASIAFFRLLAYLAAGGLVALALTPQRGVSRGFFRFSAGMYAALGAAALLLAPGEPAAPRVCIAFAAAAAAAYAVAWPAPPLLWAAGLGGAAGAALDGGGAALTSALLLGSAITAMVLGHWYLVMPQLPPDPLVRLTRLYAGSVLLRAAAVAVAAALLAGTGGRALDRYLDQVGLIVWPRLLFGLAAPAVLALMVLPAAKARDTQPATGMLYVACVLVLAGEGLAHYLWAKTGVPV